MPFHLWFGGPILKFVLKPGVADDEMEQLVAERVDTFWKGIESGASKRGQVGRVLSDNIYHS